MAVVDQDGRVLRVDHLSVAPGLRGAKRLATIEAFLRRAVGDGVVTLAALEGPSLDSVHREFDLGEVSGVARLLAYRLSGAEPLVVAPTLLKKFATGRGGASKEDVLHAVKTATGLALTNDDEADAVVLAWVARAGHTGQVATRAQAEVVKTLLSPPVKKTRRRLNDTKNL